MKKELIKARELVKRDTENGIFLCKYSVNGVKYNLYSAHTPVSGGLKKSYDTAAPSNTADDGFLNTALLKDQQVFCSYNKKEVPAYPLVHSAALCTDLGHTDWYLASINEVKEIKKSTGNLVFGTYVPSSTAEDGGFMLYDKNTASNSGGMILDFNKVYPIRRVKV